MQLADKYSPELIEQKWYDFWMEQNLFHSEPDAREPYTIVIPPPNVTGMLHMGHMLNNTLQDVLVRRARMQGKNACWVPGTDHASIATEAKVVAKLKAEGIDKSTLTREEFLKHAWEWKEKHGGIILQQLRKLIVRLGAYMLHYGRASHSGCDQGLRGPLPQGSHLSWCAHGKLGPIGMHSTLGRGGDLQGVTG